VRLKVTGKPELSFIHNFHRSRVNSEIGVSKNNLSLISSNIFRALITELKVQIDGHRGDIAGLRGDIARLDLKEIRNYNIQMLLIKKNLAKKSNNKKGTSFH
jgi:hypothetical protein